MTKATFQGVRSHVSGSYRTETLHGKEYYVVPVVALVEGVLQGMSAAGPELALAEEFGKFPDSWNGRPVVMSHPVVDGTPVSANSPAILETYQLGFLFNTQVSKEKLIQEAWIDKSLAANLNDETKSIFEALEKGETIEVSTGYFAMIEQTSGIHANKKYTGIQREITPDHLAFLPMGTLGACSNADGCGAKLAANCSPDIKFTAYRDFRVDDRKAPCCESCAETGGQCTHAHEDHMPTANAMDDKDPKKDKKKGDPKAYEATTIANTIADGVILSDVRNFVSCALKDQGYGTYCYLMALTTTQAIFEMYDMFSGEYRMYSLNYSISSDGAVTFDGAPTEVALMTTVVSVNADGNTATGKGEGDMPNDTTKPGGTAAPTAQGDAKEPTVQTLTNDQGELTITTQADGKSSFSFKANKVEIPAPKTTAEFIAQAPAEMQEVLSSSLKLHNERKKGLIEALKATKRCKLADNKLEAMSLEDLENMASLANVPTYEGVALPVSQASAEDTAESFTEAPLVFEAAATKAAA